MGEDMKQCYDRCDRDKDCKRDCDSRDFDDCDDWDWGTWLPIIIIIFLLCGGTNIFGGGCKDDCYDNGFGGSWLLILIVIFLLFSNQKDGKGFFGF